jgi:hypothetical protein
MKKVYFLPPDIFNKRIIAGVFLIGTKIALLRNFPDGEVYFRKKCITNKFAVHQGNI